MGWGIAKEMNFMVSNRAIPCRKNAVIVQKEHSVHYECILMVRPDVSPKQVGLIVDSVKAVVERSGGQFKGGEYWGFRTLAYRIEKRGKAHYVCLGMFLTDLSELTHFLKFHRDLLRYVFFKKPKGLTFPTLLFQSSLEELLHSDHHEEVVFKKIEIEEEVDLGHEDEDIEDIQGVTP
jgi:small subunit ribosomal protein S6